MIIFFSSSKKQLFSKSNLHSPNLGPLLGLGFRPNFRVWRLGTRIKGLVFGVWGLEFQGNLQGGWRKVKGGGGGGGVKKKIKNFKKKNPMVECCPSLIMHHFLIITADSNVLFLDHCISGTQRMMGQDLASQAFLTQR